MKFDYEIQKENGALNYGVIAGNEKIVFIKAGAGGSHTGYENKYLRLAHALHDKDGSTVICASNPSDEFSRKYDAVILRDITENTLCPTIKFIGASRGATLGLTELSEQFHFEKLLLINIPLMLNFHKTIKAIKDKNILFVFGERDPSVSYIPFLKRYTENIMIIEGADHQFKGQTEELIRLSEFHLKGEFLGND